MGKSATYRIVTAAISVFAGLVTASASAEEMAPLDIKLPRENFAGPHNIMRPSTVEPRTREKRPPFMAPKGVTNIALGTLVTVSDAPPIIGEPNMATDGDKEASGENNFIELAPGLQWVQIDLGARCEIFAIVVWHDHMGESYYHDVIVRVSDTADFTKHANTVFNNDRDNSAKFGVGTDNEYIETNEGRLADCKGVKGRYVRLYSNGTNRHEMNRLLEVEVYGRPAK